MKIIPLVFLALLAAAQVRAKSITISFEAEVEDIMDETIIFGERLKTGSLITGKYTFNPDTKPSIDSDFTRYEFPAVKNGMTLNLANVSLQTGGGNLSIVLINGESYDEYQVSSDCQACSEEEFIGTTATIDGWDFNGEMLSSTALPTTFPDISGPAGRPFHLTLTGDSLYLRAKITKVAADDSLLIPFVRILPASGDFLHTQRMDPVIRVDGVKPEDVKIEKILLDDVNVTTRSLENSVSGRLESDDPGAIWQLTRPTPPPGVHEFKVKVRFPSGHAAWTEVRWNVLQAKFGRGKVRIEEKR